MAIEIIGSKKGKALAQSCPTLCDPVDCSLPGTSSMGFSRQEYWSGLPLPSPGDLSYPGMEPVSPVWKADSLPLSQLGSQNQVLWKGQFDSVFEFNL